MDRSLKLICKVWLSIVFAWGLVTNSWAVVSFQDAHNHASSAAGQAGAGKIVQGPGYKEGELLVKFRPRAGMLGINSVAANLGAANVSRFKPMRSRRGGELEHWWRVSLPEGRSVEDAVSALAAHPDVEYAEPDYEVYVQFTPNDPRFSELWGLNNEGQTDGTADADIDAAEAWQSHQGSSAVVVAVIDTGVDYSHEDLAANMWVNDGEVPGNGIDDDGNGYVDDVYGYDFSNNDGDPFDDLGHGTHCAGTIAAAGDNNLGITGVNWTSRIMALKFLSSSGVGSTGDAIEAVIYATNMGAKVMNNSWGGNNFSQALEDAITAANDAGVLFVASAGNTGENSAIYPANYDVPNVMAVAATDHADDRAFFSNYGPDSVHLGAPGVDVLSSVPTGNCLLCDAFGYSYLSGTSMAAPHVSGSAALLWARFPSLTVGEVKTRLMESVDPVPSLTGTTISGGRLNVNNALNLVDYAASLLPYRHNVEHNAAGSFTLSLTSTESSDQTLLLNLDSLAQGLSGSISHSSIVVPANGNASVTVTVAADANITPGIYPVRVLIDDLSGLPSTIEARLRVINPDYNLTVTPSLQHAPPGGSVTYEVEVSSFDAFSGLVTLAADAGDATMTHSLSSTVVDVPEGGKANASLTITSSSDTPLQTHTIEVSATHDANIKTSNAQLNVMEVDLVPVSVDMSSDVIDIGEPFTVTDVIANNGRSATVDGFDVGYYLSDDAWVTTGDIYLGDRHVTGLGAGLSHSEAVNLTVPIETVAGNYYILAVVDDNNNAVEVNEDNNVLANPVSVKVTPDVCPLGCPFASIQAALDATAEHGAVIVDDGTYFEAITLESGKAIMSLNGPQATIIDATGLGVSAVDVTEGTIIGFTITGGQSSIGAGIMVTENAVIDNSIIRGNMASWSGGGLYVLNNSHTVTVTNSEFYGNSAAFYGGAIFVGDNVMVSTTIKNTKIYNNVAELGGGIYFHEYARMPPLVENTLIYGNAATKGGGLYVSQYNYLNLINSTITDNTNSGLYFDGYHLTSIQNSILWGNSMAGSIGGFAGPTITYSVLASEYEGEGNMVADPQFVNAADGNYRLAEGSPAIDSGSDTGLTDDLDSRVRPQDGDGLNAGDMGDGSDYDIGAYEYELSVVLPEAEPPAISPDGGVFSGSLTVSLSSTLAQAQIYYTLDGTLPTVSDGMPYTAPFTLNADAVVYAIAVADGYQDSEAAIAAFTVIPMDLDSDGDGMSDVWELANHLDPNVDDAAQDADSDGWNNYFEFLYDTDPHNPALYPPHEYVVLNDDMSAADGGVVSLVDGNVIVAGGSTLSLGRNQRASLPAADLTAGTLIGGSGHFSIGGNRNATDSPVPMVMQGTAFVNPHFRNDHDYFIYSPAGTANVSILVDGVVTHLSVAQGEVINHRVNDNNHQATVITSDLPILVAHQGHIQGSKQRDAYPLPPAGTEVFGIRSNLAYVGALEDNTSVTIYGSNGDSENVVLNAGGRVAVTAAGNGDDGTGDGVRVVADKPIGAVQFADSDGLEATAFLSQRFLGRHYGLPEDVQYIAVVCPQANTSVTLYDSVPITRICGGDGDAIPGKVYFGSSHDGVHINAGAYLEADQPVYLIYEATASNDEHNLFGR